jgi:predicted ribosome quality control (RQC) complex YloA/Tae2 family protein
MYFTEIQYVTQLLSPLAGAMVQKIYQPLADRVLLSLYTPSQGKVDLLLCVSPVLPRLHLSSKRWPNPPQAPSFCMLLRKHLESSRLRDACIISTERRVRLNFHRDKQDTISLVLELFGRTPSLCLLSADDLVLGVLSVSRKVEYTTGLPYLLSEAPSNLEARPARMEPTWEAIEGYFQGREDEAQRLRQEQERRRQLLREKKQLLRTQGHLQSDLAEAETQQEARHWGELIVQNLHLLKRGQTEACVVDYQSGEPTEVVVTLDPAKGPRENAERYFVRYRKSQRAKQLLGERLLTIDTRLAAIEESLQSLETDAVIELPQRTPQANPKRREQAPSLPYRCFLSRQQDRILVGKNARCNDELTTKIAKGSDLWLHSRDTPGSHVVVQRQRGRELAHETLLDAATLAAHFSKASQEAQVDVMYTEAKYVRKVKGAAPGSVTVAGAKTLRVRLDATRLTRLLATEESP